MKSTFQRGGREEAVGDGHAPQVVQSNHHDLFIYFRIVV
jgi:hypothetical protein